MATVLLKTWILKETVTDVHTLYVKLSIVKYGYHFEPTV